MGADGRIEPAVSSPWRARASSAARSSSGARRAKRWRLWRARSPAGGPRTARAMEDALVTGGHRVRRANPRPGAPDRRPTSCWHEREVNRRAREGSRSISPRRLSRRTRSGRRSRARGRSYHVAADYRLWARDARELYRATVDGTRHILTAAPRRAPSASSTPSTVGALGIPKERDAGRREEPRGARGHGWALQGLQFLAERVAASSRRAGRRSSNRQPFAPIGPWDVKPTPTGQWSWISSGQMGVRSTTGLTSSTCWTSPAAIFSAAERGRVGKKYVLGHRNMSLIEIFRRSPASLVSPAPRSGAVRIRVAVCLLHGGRGARHGRDAPGAAERGADGAKENVFHGGERPSASSACRITPPRRAAGRRRLGWSSAAMRPGRWGFARHESGQFVSRLTRRAAPTSSTAFLACRGPSARRSTTPSTPSAASSTTRWTSGRTARPSEGARALARGDGAGLRRPRRSPPRHSGCRGRKALSDPARGPRRDHRGRRDGLERSTYETFGRLYPYCYRVASAVGLCCIEICGYTDAGARDASTSASRSS